jgi:hypothetical protein
MDYILSLFGHGSPACWSSDIITVSIFQHPIYFSLYEDTLYNLTPFASHRTNGFSFFDMFPLYMLQDMDRVQVSWFTCMPECHYFTLNHFDIIKNCHFVVIPLFQDCQHRIGIQHLLPLALVGKCTTRRNPICPLVKS